MTQNHVQQYIQAQALRRQQVQQQGSGQQQHQQIPQNMLPVFASMNQAQLAALPPNVVQHLMMLQQQHAQMQVQQQQLQQAQQQQQQTMSTSNSAEMNAAVAEAGRNHMLMARDPDTRPKSPKKRK
jgi:hypothetical protein